MLYYTNANWQLHYQLLKPILQIMQILGARKTRGAHIYIYTALAVTDRAWNSEALTVREFLQW